MARLLRGHRTAVVPDYYFAAPDSLDSDKAKALASGGVVLDGTAAAMTYLRSIITSADSPYWDICLLGGTYPLWIAGAANNHGLTMRPGVTVRGTGANTVLIWGEPSPGALCYVPTAGNNVAIKDMTLASGASPASGYALTTKYQGNIYGLELSGLTCLDWPDIALYLSGTYNAKLHHFAIDGARTGIRFEDQNDNAVVHDFTMKDICCWGIAFQRVSYKMPNNFDVYNFDIEMGTPWDMNAPQELAAAAPAGSSVITVADTSTFVTALPVRVPLLRIGSGDNLEYRQFTIVDSTHLQIVTTSSLPALYYNHVAGEPVAQVDRCEHGMYLQGNAHKVHGGTIKNAMGLGIRAACYGDFSDTGSHEIYNLRILNCADGAMYFGDGGDHKRLNIHDNEMTGNTNVRTWYGAYANRCPGIFVSKSDAHLGNQDDNHYIGHNEVNITTEIPGSPRTGLNIHGVCNSLVEYNTVRGNNIPGGTGVHVYDCGVSRPPLNNKLHHQTFSGLETELLIEDDQGTTEVIQP
jgi:hypothetical protein